MLEAYVTLLSWAAQHNNLLSQSWNNSKSLGSRTHIACVHIWWEREWMKGFTWWTWTPLGRKATWAPLHLRQSYTPHSSESQRGRKLAWKRTLLASSDQYSASETEKQRNGGESAVSHVVHAQQCIERETVLMPAVHWIKTSHCGWFVLFFYTHKKNLTS